MPASGKYVFDALIRKHDKLDAAYVEFPYDARKEFNKSRVKVKVTFDGTEYRGLLTRMGSEFHWIGLTKEIRKLIGKNPGDMVHVTIMEDTEERTIDIPEDLLYLLRKEKELLDYFNGLSFTHRKEYISWIEEAKKPETRKNRLVKAIEMLRKKIRTPG